MTERATRLSTTVVRLALASIAAVIGGCTGGAQPATDPKAVDGDWHAYGHDALGSRWSPLNEITRENVGRLDTAWTFHTGELAPEFAGKRRQRSLEVTPLVVDGRMLISTPLSRVMALDPETGKAIWTFDPKVDRSVGYGDFTSRGVSYWIDTRAAGQPSACSRRVFVATIDGRLIALDAERGTPCAAFGDTGTVNLRGTLRNGPFETAEYEVTSPPAVVNDIVVVGSAVADNNRTDAASGEVRAYDARTGALRWTWDPIPQDSTDAAWATWIGPKAHATGAANAWSVIAADAERDLVFVPTGSASPDYYGGERLGDNRYANSVVALRASTGKVVWHFQVVHHDLWDYDVASPPALVTLKKDGRDIPVVLQTTKTGQLFVLHRETGQPVFRVEERPVPASDVRGEQASPTQPFNTILPPLSPWRLTPDSAYGLADDDRAACRARVAGLRNEGPFTPPSEKGTLVYPSSIGGAHWGGVTFDPVRQIAIVPVNRIPIEVRLIPNAAFDSRTTQDAAETRGPGAQYTRMRGTPYVMRRQFIFGPRGVPCSPPPFGSLVAIDLTTGTKKWDVPLGTLGGMVPPGTSPETAAAFGSINLGGAISTAGGLVFVAATLDRALRAFDVETGRELWKGALPASGKATPMTFRGPKDGRQYVVIAAGGDGELFGESDAIVAFRLR
ncbi:MAG TPA: pyrroloquinoline quinone-dependent dehydrogenase [Gemmatimonadaceae bacterium]|nr:pyrroloquinoline quinone-dependent dehydrogenase [Gemmatimonadaceae bacterium]